MPSASALPTVALTGQQHLNREEILATAGVTGRASLLFFDVADARARLLTNPWIGEATVQKLLPDRLVITIVEREPFALWQKDGRVGVIAGDGTVLEPYVVRRYVGLPLVVGTGADTRAKDFLALLDRHPELRANVRASRAGRGAALEPAAEERRRRSPAGIRSRSRARSARGARARQQAVEPRRRRDRSAAARSRYGAAVRCGRPGARRSGQEESNRKAKGGNA